MTIHLPNDLETSKPTAMDTGAPPDPLLGIWRDAPDEIDEIVAEAMQRRREEPWRAIPGEYEAARPGTQDWERRGV